MNIHHIVNESGTRENTFHLFIEQIQGKRPVEPNIIYIFKRGNEGVNIFVLIVFDINNDIVLIKFHIRIIFKDMRANKM
jgi:hypothetical protein